MNYITSKQFAERVGVAHITVRKWIERGKIKAEKAGGMWLIHEEEARVPSDRRKSDAESAS